MLCESEGDEGAGGVFGIVSENFLNLGGEFLVVDSTKMQGLLVFVGSLLRLRSTKEQDFFLLVGATA